MTLHYLFAEDLIFFVVFKVFVYLIIISSFNLNILNYFGDIRLKRMKFKSIVFLAIVNIFAFLSLLEAKNKLIKIEKMTQCANSVNLSGKP